MPARQSSRRAAKPRSPSTSADGSFSTHEAVATPIAELSAHPRNYRAHPDDQLDHLAQSLREHGVYRNVVAARDGTILAGHGVVEAARREGVDTLPVIRLDVDPEDPRALKILTGDNELARLAEVDDRLLSEILRDVKNHADLIGTGYDEQMLANLVYMTRPEGEIRDFNAAAEWVGMPEFEPVDKPLQAVVSFESEEDRDRFMELISVERIYKRTRGTWSFWWPDKPYEKPAAQEFKAE